MHEHGVVLSLWQCRPVEVGDEVADAIEQPIVRCKASRDRDRRGRAVKGVDPAGDVAAHEVALERSRTAADAQRSIESSRESLLKPVQRPQMSIAADALVDVETDRLDRHPAGVHRLTDLTIPERRGVGHHRFILADRAVATAATSE